MSKRSHLTVRQLHKRATALFEVALVLNAHNERLEYAQCLNRAAARLESEAAKRAAGQTRGILYQSAAWCAIYGGERQCALDCVMNGLATDALPDWLRDELKSTQQIISNWKQE